MWTSALRGGGAGGGRDSSGGGGSKAGPSFSSSASVSSIQSTKTWTATLNDLTKRATTGLHTLGDESVQSSGTISIGNGSQLSGDGGANNTAPPMRSRRRSSYNQQQQHQQQPRGGGVAGGGGGLVGQQHQSSRSNLETLNEDAVSVLTYDPLFHEQTPEELLDERDDEIQELKHLMKINEEKLEETKSSYDKLAVTYKEDNQVWKRRIEQLESEKNILQDRLRMMEKDISDEDLIHQISTVISDEAPKEFHRTASDDEMSDDDMKSASSSSSYLRFNQSRRSTAQDSRRIQVLEKYILNLQVKLGQAMQSMAILANQITVLQESSDEQLKNAKQTLLKSEQELIKQQVDYTSKLDALRHEKRMAEEALLTKLEIKTEKMDRLEELVEELRDMSVMGKLSSSQFEGTVAIQNLTDQFDALSKERDKQALQHYAEKEAMEMEIRRLRQRNEELERSAEQRYSGGMYKGTSSNKVVSPYAHIESPMIENISISSRNSGESYNPQRRSSISRHSNRVYDMEQPLKDDRYSSTNMSRTNMDGRYSSHSSQTANLRHGSSSSGSLHSMGGHTSQKYYSDSRGFDSQSNRNEREIYSTSNRYVRTGSSFAHQAASGALVTEQVRSSPRSERSESSQQYRYVARSRSDSDSSGQASDFVSIGSEEKSLHVHQHRHVDRQTVRRLSEHLQEEQWSKMDRESVQRRQSALNRFL